MDKEPYKKNLIFKICDSMKSGEALSTQTTLTISVIPDNTVLDKCNFTSIFCKTPKRGVWSYSTLDYAVTSAYKSKKHISLSITVCGMWSSTWKPHHSYNTFPQKRLCTCSHLPLPSHCLYTVHTCLIEDQHQEHSLYWRNYLRN